MCCPSTPAQTAGLFRPAFVIVEEEVQLDTDKNTEERQAKWFNFYQNSGGRLHIMRDNRSCMTDIRSEINYCLMSHP
jgi:hypothetical protein